MDTSAIVQHVERLAGDCTDRIVDRFRRCMRFDFVEDASVDSPRSLGLAPDDRVGVLDIIDGTDVEVSFLFTRDPAEKRDREWIDYCLVALADTTGIDFLGWLRTVTRRRGATGSWVAQRRFQDARVALRFDPVDIMVLTIHRSRARAVRH